MTHPTEPRACVRALEGYNPAALAALVEALELAAGRLQWAAASTPGAAEPEGRALLREWADEANTALTAFRAGGAS